MNKKISLVAFILIFLGCIAIMDYPFVARIFNERVQGKAVLDYEKRIEKMDREVWQAQLDRAKEYNQRLASGSGLNLGDAFEAVQQNPGEYETFLNVGRDGIMAWLEIPAIQVTLPVYHGTSERSLQKGAGHLEGTSLPVGGRDTHTVISAHRGLPSKKMFTDLDQIEAGDLFYIHIFQSILAYRVKMVETVTPDNTKALAVRPGQDLATLVTCTPYGINSHRMYVHGERIPYEKAVKEESGKTGLKERIRNDWWMLLSVLLILWMGILIHRYCRSENGKT